MSERISTGTGAGLKMGSKLGACDVCKRDLAVFGMMVRCISCGLPVPNHPETLRMKKMVEELNKVPPRPAVSQDAPAGAVFTPAVFPSQVPVVENKTMLDGARQPAVQSENLPAIMNLTPAVTEEMKARIGAETEKGKKIKR